MGRSVKYFSLEKAATASDEMFDMLTRGKMLHSVHLNNFRGHSGRLSEVGLFPTSPGKRGRKSRNDNTGSKFKGQFFDEMYDPR